MPDGVKEIEVTLVSGGAGGGGRYNVNGNIRPANGGAGSYVVNKLVSIAPNISATIYIGGGGGGYGASDGGSGTHGYVIIKYLKNEKCTIANCALCAVDGKCSACVMGYKVNAVGICEKCLAGTYYEDGECKTCPVGFACPDGTSKNLCADGTYTDNSGEAACYDCPGGSYCKDGIRKHYEVYDKRCAWTKSQLIMDF